MTNLPDGVRSPKQQQRLSRELYALLDSQVKSYHQYYKMGNNSSVPAEIAEELLASVRYTLEACGGYLPSEMLTVQLERGQAVLKQQLERAREAFRLVSGTVPDGQSQCHWESVHALGRYLDGYDLLHFAHRRAENLDYPLLTPAPEELRGIDYALYWLRCLWLEHQLLDSFPDGALTALYSRVPPDYWEAPQNLCEQPLWNAMGCVLLGRGMGRLEMEDEDRQNIGQHFCHASPEVAEETLCGALKQALTLLNIRGAGLLDYTAGAVRQLCPRLLAALSTGNLEWIFV